MKSIRWRRRALFVGVAAATAIVTLAGQAMADSSTSASWRGVKPYINSGFSTSGMSSMTMKWYPEAASKITAISAAYSAGKLSADTQGPGLAQVFANLNRSMIYKTSCGSTANSEIAAADSQYTLAAWCPDNDDESTSAWLPQSMTTAQDSAYASGYTPPDADGLVTLWREPTPHAGTSVPADPCNNTNTASEPDSIGLRAGFMDLPSTTATGDTGAYRYVMLVEPTLSGTQLNFTPICNMHGSGVLWYGHYLFVTQHSGGIKVFDTDLTYKIPNDQCATTSTPNYEVGLKGSAYCAANYRYVMFQVGEFKTPGLAAGTACPTVVTSVSSQLCFASLTLDRSDSAFVTSEYRASGDMDDSSVGTRIVNWPAASFLSFLSTNNTTGTITAGSYAVSNFEGVQGVFERVESGAHEFFLSRTIPSGHGAELWYEQDGDGVCASRGTYVDDAEAISYWLDSSSTGHLWTWTEYANIRMLTRVYTNEYNDAPSGCPTQQLSTPAGDEPSL